MRVRAALRHLRTILSSPTPSGTTSQPQLRDYPIAHPPYQPRR
jgi:hypothetical protein